MPTIGNTSLPYYSPKTAINTGAETKTLQQTAKPITVLKADPPPSVELQEAPKLDLGSEIQKPQGINLESLQAPEKAPASIASFNATELKEIQALDVGGEAEGIEFEYNPQPSGAISELSSSLALTEFASARPQADLTEDPVAGLESIAVNVNQNDRNVNDVLSFEDTGTMITTDQISVNINQNHRTSGSEAGVIIDHNHQTAASSTLSTSTSASFEDSGTLHFGTDQVAVNINQNHRTVSDVLSTSASASFEDTGTIHREADQAGVIVNNNHRTAEVSSVLSTSSVASFDNTGAMLSANDFTTLSALSQHL